jgi:hypothetical protein
MLPAGTLRLVNLLNLAFTMTPLLPLLVSLFLRLMDQQDQWHNLPGVLDLLVLDKMLGIRMLVVWLFMVLLVMVLLVVNKLLDQLLDQPHQLIDMLLGMHLVMLMLLDKLILVVLVLDL